ncbi:hypothetical protein [Variovorax atrisoli]|uniref:hypothetical protein n=1 Tax=Variovorax atrisoli TaxID=3394203 RepID=UPI004040243B
MIEDTAWVQKCLQMIDEGERAKLSEYELAVLQTAGLIEPLDVFPRRPLDRPEPLYEFKLTKAGRAKLPPPKK